MTLNEWCPTKINAAAMANSIRPNAGRGMVFPRLAGCSSLASRRWSVLGPFALSFQEVEVAPNDGSGNRRALTTNIRAADSIAF